MPFVNQGPGKGRYIIRCEDPKQATELIARIKQDSGIELLDVLGPTNQPHTIVAEMHHEKADFLEQDLILAQPRMTIELDRPLTLLDQEKKHRFDGNAV